MSLSPKNTFALCRALAVCRPIEADTESRTKIEDRCVERSGRVYYDLVVAEGTIIGSYPILNLAGAEI